jgi:hypothetical protein
MRSAASAIAWAFGRRHRWGLIAVGGYFLALAILKLLILDPSRVVVIKDEQTFAFVVVIPLTVTFMYALGVFSFGLDGDLAARGSMYPARMLTLPVTTSALAAWPMAYGAASMALLWLATRYLAVWPSGFDIPVLWPALLAASLLAWTQALTWMPYPWRGCRVVAIVLWLATIDTIVMVALYARLHESVVLALLAPHVPLAYVAARYAVARARRGDIPGWRGLRIADVRPMNPRDGFPSAARAQVWFEWRRYGRTLPALVAMLLPFECVLLRLFRETPAIVVETLLMMLLTPPVMAGFVAATVSRSSGTFTATRPLSSASLIGAPLKAAIWSVTAAWALVLAVIPIALVVSGAWPVAIERIHATRAVFGAPRAAVLAVAGCAALMVWTWKRLVQGLYIGLTGRGWLIKGHVFLTLVVASVAVSVIAIGRSYGVVGAIWDALPVVLAVLVCLKMSAAVWIVMRLHRGRLISDRTLVTGAACWSAAVLALFGLLAWFVGTPLVPHHLLLLIAILAVPLARLSAAPLALAWNRHR